jgi:hypothetical protein
MGHGVRTLMAHLEGTERLLRTWGARSSLCDAGLFHSVFGTESFKGELIPLHLRPEVQAIIGKEAERLVWLFGVLEKVSFYELLVSNTERIVRHRQSQVEIPITIEEFRDLCELTTANWLEQRPKVAEKYKFIRTNSFVPCSRG